MTKNSCGGFTLVEMIVSLAIFAIVAVVALTALVKIIDANAKAQSIQAAVTSLSYSLDTMSRELRSGSNVQCQNSADGTVSSFSLITTPCPGGGSPVLFFQTEYSNQAGNCRLWYAYYFTTNPWQVSKAQQPSNSANCTSTITPDMYTPIIPSNVTLTLAELKTSYNASTQPYPLIFLQLMGYAGAKEQTKTYFMVQTAASPRSP